MNKLGLTSRICHSHVLKQWSINTPWMPQGQCPKQRKTNPCQERTWGKKKIHSILLLNAVLFLFFWGLFQLILWATSRGTETKHVVSIMHLDSVSLELETLVFFSDCKMKRLKSRQRAAWERLLKAVQLWRRRLFMQNIAMSSAANPVSMWSLGTHCTQLSSVCRGLHPVTWGGLELLQGLIQSWDSWVQQSPHSSQISRTASVIIYLSALASCGSAPALWSQGLYSQKHLVLPYSAKHCFLYIQYCISSPWRKFFENWKMCAVPGHVCRQT